MVEWTSSEGTVVMGWLWTLVVSSAALAISGTLARAADMPDYPSLPLPSHEKSLQFDEFVSGWYLRGDVGYRFQKVSGASDPANDYSDNSIKNAFIGGVGAGFKAQWFRADITGDYGWRSLYSGTNASTGNSVSAEFDIFAVMLNGYLDLGNWAGFTPYIGGGIGSAYVSTTSYETMPPQATLVSPVARWNRAWAVMAGVSYNLSYNVLLDVGYRHIDMGDVISGSDSNQLTVKKLTGDEVRVGIRYVLD
jgi:opacity protein-like surface antigen